MKPGFDYAQALAEAERCLLCHDAPCSQGCPAETDPGSFIRKLRLQNLTGALRTIKRNNILGGACGVLCPTAELCEKECAATAIDRPIRIGEIQRFLVEHGRETGFSPLSAPPADAQAERGKVAVIGAGPAGLSCAAELAQAGYAVTIFEARERAGGVLAYGVPAYRFSDDFIEQELDDVRRLGVEFQCSHPIQGEGAAEALLTQGFSAVFVGSGCWQAMRLDVAGADGPGVFTCVDFLAEGRAGARRPDGGKALAEQVRGKTVAVLGGGSVATDCAGSALRLGAKDVYIVYRRSYNEMPAEEEERIEALREGVHLLVLQQPKGYRRDADGALTGLELRRTRLGEPDTSGRRRPVEISGSDWTLDIDVAVEALGYRPVDSERVAYPSVSCRDDGRVLADEATGRTSKEGIFAGGDIVRGPSLVVKAVQDGKLAARAIVRYLSEGGAGEVQA